MGRFFLLKKDIRREIAFGYQVDNGKPIESWFDDSNDMEDATWG